MTKSFRDVIDLWGSPDAMAKQIGASPWAVRKWRQRNNIPAEWWVDIVRAATRIDLPVTFAVLANLAARDTPEAAE